MKNFEQDYMNLVDKIVNLGEDRKTRAGPTKSHFGTILTIDSLEDGQFPVLTTRKVFTEGIWGELAAFVRGTENLVDFKHWGCNYWDANAAAWPPNKGKVPAEMSVGPIYGKQWRDFNRVDQLKNLITNLKRDPLSRRHVITTFNPAEEGCLPPCHLMAQFNITNHGWLECIVYMRSVDLILGLPSDIILYATLLLLIAQDVGRTPGYLTFMMGDTHVYTNHIEGWKAQRAHTTQELPTYELNSLATTIDFVPDDIVLRDYIHQGKITYELNV
jgi:thymidylate synthase